MSSPCPPLADSSHRIPTTRPRPAPPGPLGPPGPPRVRSALPGPALSGNAVAERHDLRRRCYTGIIITVMLRWSSLIRQTPWRNSRPVFSSHSRRTLPMTDIVSVRSAVTPSHQTVTYESAAVTERPRSPLESDTVTEGPTPRSPPGSEPLSGVAHPSSEDSRRAQLSVAHCRVISAPSLSASRARRGKRVLLIHHNGRPASQSTLDNAPLPRPGSRTLRLIETGRLS